MKHFLIAYFLLTCVTNSFAQKSEDIKAIKAMCGCYEVKFNFAETFAYPQDSSSYKPSKTKYDVGLEWVELVEDKADKIVMQHLLIVNDTMIIKHWRQDWQFESTEYLSYNGFEDWKRIQLPKNEVKGQWTQKVYQVDDSPRYEGTGTWIHKDQRTYWESFANAPLPRREFTIRKDYNLLKRRNRHEITTYGWLHEQDNDKIIRDENGKEHLLAQEKGLDTYTKVDDKKCLAGQKWWAEHKELWAKIRNKWNSELSNKAYIKLKKQLNNKPLFMHLFALKPTATQAEISAIIDNFFEIKK